MALGFFSKFASIWLVLNVSVSSVSYLALQNLGTSLHVAAYASTEADSTKIHHDSDGSHYHKPGNQPGGHQHHHGPDQPVHEHAHFPTGSSFAFPAMDWGQGLAPAYSGNTAYNPANDQVPPSVILATSIRTPIA